MRNSILDRYELTLEKFEDAIAVGRTPTQILIMFNKTSKEMDEFCKANYNADFKLAYEWVRQCCVDHYLHCVHDMGMAGNPSALAIIDKAIQKDESMNTVKIEFVTQLPQEGADDKLNDD